MLPCIGRAALTHSSKIANAPPGDVPPSDQPRRRGGRHEVQIGNAQLLVGGDLITSIDGKPVDRNDAITRALGKKHAGDTIELTIFRDGRTTNLRIKLGESALA